MDIDVTAQFGLVQYKVQLTAILWTVSNVEQLDIPCFSSKIKPSHSTIFATTKESMGVIWNCNHFVSGAGVTTELIIVGFLRIIQV